MRSSDRKFLYGTERNGDAARGLVRDSASETAHNADHVRNRTNQGNACGMDHTAAFGAEGEMAQDRVTDAEKTGLTEGSAGMTEDCHSDALGVFTISRRTLLRAASTVFGGTWWGLLGPMPVWGQDTGGAEAAGADTSANTGEVLDCGPPPQAAPQHRSGGESFPPLPLPATPLRRTEKKRPPSPPALIGKMALGTAKWVTKEGKRSLVRDWMTDPADLDTLMKWTNSQLGIQYRPMNIDFQNFSFDPRELPAILLAGHNTFSLTDEIRDSLRQYVLDGGMIIGDACCGWNDFAVAFRKEMEQIFPGRPLRKVVPEDPLYSAFHKIEQVTYKEADGSTRSDVPCLESIDFGCRAGVVFSPVDMTCGWDGHEHPRGTRYSIEHARQLGANLVTYLLGNFSLARFLSTTKVYFEAEESGRGDFVFTQLIHDGDWDPDPSAAHNLLKYTQENSTLEVKFKRETISLSDAAVATAPMLYMTGHREFHWSDEDGKIIRKYLEGGGTLLADACCGRIGFDLAFRQAMEKIFPDTPLKRMDSDHPVFSTIFELERCDYTSRVYEDYGELAQPELEGIELDGRLAVLYTRFDLGNGWEGCEHPYAYGYESESALQLGANILAYTMMH
ncbi:MAG: DUF4159 domain-containing protein [Thermoguttaceae bacterium]|nr:DUF4159 domain-containing protein [Thermoguttaceae bacterium]